MNSLGWMRRPNAFRRMLTAGLLLACGLQASVSWSSYIRPTAEKAWDLKALPVWQRTATLMFDEDTAGFLGFLRDTVPEEARVVVPPRSEGSIYEEIGMMQYFLIPREIHNCGKDEVEACVRRATGESTYILAVHYFPPRDLARETRRQIHYDDNRGVFAPP